MDPFIGEIRIFGFNFAPAGWALCNGQLLPIAQNTALFSLLGVMYGGNGITMFALPNLQGRAALAPGQGTGLTLRQIGDAAGEQSVGLLPASLPAHAHPAHGETAVANSKQPANDCLAQSNNGLAYAAPGSLTPMASNTIGPAGGNQAHNNMQPYLTLNFCIALLGVFPPRS